MADEKWTISIDRWGGYCPSYFDNDFAFYGNKNQSTTNTDIDIRDINVLTQGASALALTGGTQAGELGSHLIKSIMKHAVSDDATYAVSENKVFKITNTAITGASSITGSANVVIDDLIWYQGSTYVFWNSPGIAGEIAKVDVTGASAISNWGSTDPIGAASLADAPHYAIVGGDDVCYFTDGRWVGKIDGSTLGASALDFWQNSETKSVSWNGNRVIIAVNRPNVSGSNYNLSGIYKWNGISSSWEGDPIEVGGEIGALFTDNGITYVWWKDSVTTGAYNFGFINGLRLERIRRYSGSLPNQAQVGGWDGYIGWLSNNQLVLWGAKDRDNPVEFFRYMSPTGASATGASAGTWAAPFGTPLVTSYEGSNYYIQKASGYSTLAVYNTMAFNMRKPGFRAQIDLIQVGFETLASGAKLDTTITYNQTTSTLELAQVAYDADDNTTLRKIYSGGLQCDDFRIDFSWANGSNTNPVKIRTLLISGSWVKSN